MQLILHILNAVVQLPFCQHLNDLASNPNPSVHTCEAGRPWTLVPSAPRCCSPGPSAQGAQCEDSGRGPDLRARVRGDLQLENPDSPGTLLTERQRAPSGGLVGNSQGCDQVNIENY